MRTAIIGTGGVGGYYGAKLKQAGCDVSFLARGAHLEAMQREGLTVKSLLGDFHVGDLTATDNIREIGTADLIILAVKSWQVKEIREELKTIMHETTVILPLQNGVLAVDELAGTIDRKNILGGMCRIISKIESPGVINHFGVTPTIVFGETDHSRSERVRKIKDLFDRAGIKSRISGDIDSDIWKKFMAVCVSGLLAVTRTTYGEIRELKETRQMMIDLLNEIYALSQKMGINIEPGFVDQTVEFFDSLPYGANSSLTRDVMEGKPSEIEYQNGTVVRLAREYGVEVPVNQFVYYCILPMERKARRN